MCTISLLGRPSAGRRLSAREVAILVADAGTYMVRFGVGVLSDEVLVHNDVKVQFRCHSGHCRCGWRCRSSGCAARRPRVFRDQCDLLHVWRVIQYTTKLAVCAYTVDCSFEQQSAFTGHWEEGAPPPSGKQSRCARLSGWSHPLQRCAAWLEWETNLGLQGRSLRQLVFTQHFSPSETRTVRPCAAHACMHAE